jgi:hypothetical protein
MTRLNVVRLNAVRQSRSGVFGAGLARGSANSTKLRRHVAHIAHQKRGLNLS